MINPKSVVYAAPSVQGRIVSWQNNGSLPPYIVVENMDPTSSAPIKYQSSDDGSTWSDVAGTTASVNPGTSNGQIVTSGSAYLALSAGGNVMLLVSVVRQVNGAPASLGAA